MKISHHLLVLFWFLLGSLPAFEATRPKILARDYRYDCFSSYTYGGAYSNEICYYCSLDASDDLRSEYDKNRKVRLFLPKSLEELDVWVIPSTKKKEHRWGDCNGASSFWVDDSDTPEQQTEKNRPRYTGYIHFRYNKDFPFLKRQIAYSKKYPNYQAYWVETSPLAEQISQVACTRFSELVETTALKKVDVQPSLQKDFITDSWLFKDLADLLSISLGCNCFRFSDYYQVAQDLEEYSKKHFSRQEARLIAEKLQRLLDELAPLFLQMYQESVSRHPTPEMAEELKFLRKCLGDNPEDSSFKEASFNKQGFSTESNLYALDQHDIRIEDLEDYRVAGDSYQPDWLKALVFLAQGETLNDFLLYQAAIEALTEAIRYAPQSANAYAERAHAYFELGQLDKALQDYGKYKELRTISFIVCESPWNGSEETFDSNPLISEASLYYPQRPLDYAGGFCLGTLKGISVSVETFVPSTLSTLSGIGQGLWAFVCSPKEMTQDIIEASYALVEFVSTHTPRENLEQMVPELKSLCLNWNKLSDYERGHQTGFIIGKYGVDIFGPAATMKYIKKFRDLKRANSLLTLHSCAYSEAKRVKIVEEATKKVNARKALFNDRKVKIHRDKQNKHIPGSHNFAKEEGKILVAKEELQELIEKHLGTGEKIPPNAPGSAGYKERVNFGKVIGEYAHIKNGSFQGYHPTTMGIIHYDGEGYVHVVPARPINFIEK